MDKNKQTLFITGATGFIGSYLVNRVKDYFNIYALSRRHPKNYDYINHPNIEWIQTDIGDTRSLSKAFQAINPDYSVDFIVHLAGFYDFNYDENPEYERTNIQGTRNVLEESKKLNIKRFIFASSVAACDFPRKNGSRIDEKTPADGGFAYALSKRKGEEFLREYSAYFNCSVVRFAAAFSDWCEYGPLYIFLDTWLNKNWKSRIIGGKGHSAIPYIHVNCLTSLLLKLMHKSEALPKFDTYIASSSTSASHDELFSLATRFFYGESCKPFHLPKVAAFLGVLAVDLVGRLLGHRPFERPWMMRYVDKQMLVDCSYTRDQLDWMPTKRYVIQRRLLYMIEHMKSYPFEWKKRNSVTLKLASVRPNFRIYEALDNLRENIIQLCMEQILDPDNSGNFASYYQIDQATLRKDTATLYQFLSVAVRSKDRMSIINYAREIAQIRSRQGFNPQEVLNAVQLIGTIIHNELVKQDSLKGMEQEIYDEINLTFRLVKDEVEGEFEAILRKKHPLHTLELKRSKPI